MRGGDDSLVALSAGFVSMRRVSRSGEGGARIKGGHVVSVKPTAADAQDPKAAKVSFLRVLARTWMKAGQHVPSGALASAPPESFD